MGPLSVMDMGKEGGDNKVREDLSLAYFSKCLGFSIKGCEEEVLCLLTRLHKRRIKVNNENVKSLTRFDRELKRLESSINYE